MALISPWFDMLSPSQTELFICEPSFKTNGGGSCGRTRQRDRSRMDIVEHDKHYEVTIDAPGLAQEDIKIELKEGSLRITGEKSAEHTQQNEQGKVIYSERRKQSFFRSFPLPDDADDNTISASHLNGVLSISIQKKEPEKPRVVNIPVLSGQQQQQQQQKTQHLADVPEEGKKDEKEASMEEFLRISI